jgi:transcription elongation factor SPT6
VEECQTFEELEDHRSAFQTVLRQRHGGHKCSSSSNGQDAMRPLFRWNKKNGLAGMAARFGLTPQQFAENLKDGYQKVDVEQEAQEPTEVAETFVNERFKTPTDVLNAAKFMVAVQISRNPTVRKVARDAFFERCTFNVKPTKKGREEIDESHNCYAIKYLRYKAVRTLRGDQWLRLIQAEEQKMLEIKLGEDIPSVGGSNSFMEEAKELFKHDAYSKSVQEWNTLRQEAVEIAFKVL